ncbi:glutamate receptor-interacting protein 1 isoform X1 [Anopheles gambiae]|uniref:glutamate receptor-interacting protein 1 isoform X1 n=2 Tax=Anopheles gambiae TaxID=7165 RepID=UPI002AC90196|nr:glutamate receptor-interacting protein 1 isoform X1 [Anopheles gambiae]XP_061517701.1 glutamate receptor-interacting protein 1 isoform X1 [Anopheles gambiae]XP_061517708.1 glutamate receptor-interacting protein 1 isoform X1 [Anopheles gambiae]XP_061517719.1 glutamate receptor-interacting protein 1 isoform X1 [Anopheles gambiae]XP_061517730.1 glutamate receptor-interacting protein 1 isoform X1 [Anopheles gambiae]XP_061517738.1 glutamate receptor-interacting protein 1 isoform X1 [Anopheles ga
MKLWKSKKGVAASSGTTTSCVSSSTGTLKGGGGGGMLSKTCKFSNGGNGGSSSNQSSNGSSSSSSNSSSSNGHSSSVLDDSSAETSFINHHQGTNGTLPQDGAQPGSGVVSAMVQHSTGNIFSASDRAMSPAQSEDSGLAADRGTTYATISIPRDSGQIGIVLAERNDLSFPPMVESISGPVADLLAPGDRIHQVDGVSTIGLSNQQIFSILCHGEGPAVIEIEYSFPEYISQNSLCVTTKIAQITVERENGCLGLTLRGGGEYPLVVTNVRMNGPVFKTGQIKPGDRVLRVDNVSLLNKSLSEAQHILKDVHASGYTNLMIEYDVSVMQTVELSMGPLLLEIERPMNEKLGLILSNYSSAVNLNDIYHSSYKLNEVQPDGIFIASILPASIADRCGALTVGDQILSIDESVVDNGVCTLEEATALLDANCVKGYTQLHILPAHMFVRRRGISCSSPRYGFNTVDSRKNLAGGGNSKHARRLLRKSSLPQTAEDGLLQSSGGLCRAEKIHLILDCSAGSGICLGPKTACGRGFLIAQILPDSVAERSGCLQKGDRLIAINKLRDLDVNAARQLLGDYGPVTVANHYHNQAPTSHWVELEVEFDMADAVVPASGVFNIKLRKQSRCGLGITVNGNAHGSFLISEVKPGSAAHRTGSLRAGDLLMAVDNRPLQHYNLDLLLKESKNECITLTVKRNSLPDFLYDAQQKPAGLYGSAEESGAFTYGNRYTDGTMLKMNSSIESYAIEDQLRRPVWSSTPSYDGAPMGTGQGTGTLKAPTQPGGSAEHLPLPPAHLLTMDSEPADDRYDDILHYKMVSMNISNSNYVGFGANGSSPDTGLTYGNEQPPPPPPPLQAAPPPEELRQRVFTVRLEPNGGPLGITLAASEDLQKPIKISAVTEGGVAHTVGQLQVGDCLLAINGESVSGVPLTTATKLLQKFENVVDLQIARVEPVPAGGGVDGGSASAVYAKVQRRPRSPSINDAASNSSYGAAQTGPPGGGTIRTMHVTLFKDRVYDDYGFSVSDGLYERGVYINRIRSGGPADLAGLLRPFDRIVQVNGTKTQDFDCCLTVPLIAAAGDKIELVIQRTLAE